MSKTAEYFIWKSMKARCHNERDRSFQWYGALGVTVCDRWRDSFEQFFQDMGARPSPKHSIDRIDPSGHYGPDNCRWTTNREQALTRRGTATCEIDGRRVPLYDLAEAMRVPPHAVAYWVRRYGEHWIHALVNYRSMNA
jgi:hypothetical protein